MARTVTSHPNHSHPRPRGAELAHLGLAIGIGLLGLGGLALPPTGTAAAETSTPVSQPSTSSTATLLAAMPGLTIPRLTTPGEATTGSLLLRTEQPGKFIEAPRVATNVEVTVNGPVARAVVTQRFLNPSDAWVEGVYVFPLVQDAAVDGLRMKIGNRFIEGVIKERAAARARYEAAKAEGKKASLIEQERPNVFTNSVANIGPGETVVVQIAYQHTPVYKDGAFSLRVPLVVAPRYHPVKRWSGSGSRRVPTGGVADRTGVGSPTGAPSGWSVQPRRPLGAPGYRVSAGRRRRQPSSFADQR